MAILRRIGNLFRRTQVDREINDELQAHIALRVDDNVAAGMAPEDARRDALLRFGNPTSTRERVAAADTALSLGSFARNVRLAFRRVRRSPGFAATAILALALGIGPNVAIFSMIWAIFLAPLPYPQPDQLAVVWTHYKGERWPTRAEDFAQYAAQSQTMRHVDFLSWNSLHLTNPDHTEDEVTGSGVTPGFYSGDSIVPFALGRDFLPDEGLPGNDHEVILTHRLWTEHYHADRDILGKPILVDDQPYTVVGVLEPIPTDKMGVHFVYPVVHPVGAKSDDEGNVFCRMKPGVTIEQAQAELTLIDERIAPLRNGGKDAGAWTVTVEPLKNDWLDRKFARNMWLLLASVGLVLLIACANVANLLLARGASRRQEMAVRTALGATRRQVFVQLITESLALAAVGGVIGVAMGWGIMKLSMAILPLQNMTAEADVHLNLPVVGFAFVITLAAGVLFGCAPGWQASQLNLSEVLKQGSRAVGGRSRAPIQSVLVTVEIALALILLAGAGMALHSFWNLTHIDLGFNGENVLTGFLIPKARVAQVASASDTSSQGGATPAASAAFRTPEQMMVQQHLLLERLRATPGVVDAGLGRHLPLRGADPYHFMIAGQPVDPAQAPMAQLQVATPGFFRTLGFQLVSGRYLEESDTLSSPRVAMVNETFVRRYLNGGMGGLHGGATGNTDPMSVRVLLPLGDSHGGPLSFHVVGVFHDVHNSELTDEAQPEVYISLWQSASLYVAFAVRIAGDAQAVSTAVRRVIARTEPGTSIDEMEMMQRLLETQRVNDRFGMVLFGGFAAVALVLAAVGIYGVMSFAVAQRTHEIGVRMALGARRGAVVMLMVRGGMRLALVGVGVGLVGAFVLGRLMHSALYGVESADALSLVGVAALLLGVAGLACWIPARRSAAIDPVQALRNE